MARKAEIPSLRLFIIAVLLLAGGWMISSFPVFIFFGIAPLFALSDRVSPASPAWEKMEWILLALTIALLAASAFHPQSIVPSMVYAIVLTFSFLGHAWLVQVLGSRAGKITIILFWLALEYVFLILKPDSSFYLADALRLQPTWTRWNIHTGYLGSSCWILLVNACAYNTYFSRSGFHWPWLAGCVILLLGPITYSFFLDMAPISRSVMVSVYGGRMIVPDVAYLAHGEWVVRTAAWLSILILLYTFVKKQTKK